MNLELLPEAFAVCRIDSGPGVLPDWARTSETTALLAVCWTDRETSIVLPSVRVPAGVRAESGFRALRIAGVLPFHLSGVLSSLLEPLAATGVPVFTLSTFDTDYVLVRETDLERAIRALEAAGHFLAGNGIGK